MSNPIIRAKNGWEFEVQAIHDNAPDMEAPFRLVRVNGRPPFKGRAYRLIKNQRNPALCFPIPEGNVMAESVLDLWFTVTPLGVEPRG
jgi:hypothetical protein